jgi:anti-sigma regulatory factor (Ser/Thr protein kinase)
MDARRNLDVPGSPEGIRRAATELQAFFADHRLDRGMTWPFQVALDEVLSNIVQHGLAGAGQAARIEIELRLGEQELELSVVDDAPPFDPLRAEPPDTGSGPEQRPLGGLGIMLVRRLMDAVEYRRQDGRNRLSMRRRLGTVVPED